MPHLHFFKYNITMKIIFSVLSYWLWLQPFFFVVVVSLAFVGRFLYRRFPSNRLTFIAHTIWTSVASPMRMAGCVLLCWRLSLSTFFSSPFSYFQDRYKLAHIDRNIADYSCHEIFQSESVRSWGHFDDNEWIVIERKCLKNFSFFFLTADWFLYVIWLE